MFLYFLEGLNLRNFIAFIFSPALFFLVYDLVFYWLPISNKSYEEIYGYYYILYFSDFLSVISILFCLFVFFEVRKKEIQVVSKENRLSISVYFCFLIFSFVLISYLVFSVFGGFEYYSVITDNSKFYALSKRGTAWVFVILYSVAFLFLFDIYRYGPEIKRMIFLFLLLGLIGFTGGRSIIIVFAFFAFFAFYLAVVKWGIKVGFIKTFLLVTLLLAFFLGSAIMRAKNLDTYINASSKYDFDNAFILNDTIRYISDHGHEKLLSLEDFYNLFIPRSLNENKQCQLQRLGLYIQKWRLEELIIHLVFMLTCYLT